MGSPVDLLDLQAQVTILQATPNSSNDNASVVLQVCRSQDREERSLCKHCRVMAPRIRKSKRPSEFTLTTKVPILPGAQLERTRVADSVVLHSGVCDTARAKRTRAHLLEISRGLKEPARSTRSRATHRSTRTMALSSAASVSAAAASARSRLEWRVARAHGRRGISARAGRPGTHEVVVDHVNL